MIKINLWITYELHDHFILKLNDLQLKANTIIHFNEYLSKNALAQGVVTTL